MSRKTLFKATAIVVCFAILALSMPGTAQARPNINIKRIIRTPISFLSSLFSFIPVLSPHQDSTPPEQAEDSSNINKKIKTTGELDSIRLVEKD